MTDTSTVLQIRIPVMTKERLARVAKDNGKTMSAYILESLVFCMDCDESDPDEVAGTPPAPKPVVSTPTTESRASFFDRIPQSTAVRRGPNPR